MVAIMDFVAMNWFTECYNVLAVLVAMRIEQ